MGDYYLLGAGVAVVVLLVAWPKLKTVLPAAWSGAVTNAIATASDATTDAVTATAFQTLAVAGWCNSDIVFLTKLDECRQLQKAWNVTVPAAAAPTVAELAATVAELQAKLAAQSTSTIPPAAVNGA